jgi:dihydrolipoamide dehydrogenase
MNYDIIIIGSGPGGYVAAIRAAQLGLKVAIVERESLGGICLNWGCIPTKALLKSANVFEYITHAADYGIKVQGSEADFGAIIKRSRAVAEGMSKGVQFLMKKNKIDVIMGTGKIKKGGKVEVLGADGSTKEYTAKHTILATGGRSRELPNLKQDGKKVIGYRQAMVLAEQPKSMVVVGSGAIGVEFAYFYNALGTKVTIVEYLDNIVPVEDEDISKQLVRSFKKSGINIMTGTNVESVDTSGKTCKVTVKTAVGTEVIECDVVLSAVGYSPNLENLGLEEVGITVDKGRVQVDDFYKTNIEGVYAIGDIVKGQALAHVASAEGIICVEKIAGHHPEPLNYNNIPGCTYCSPEIASVGYTEKAAKEKGYELKIGRFPFMGNGKAVALGEPEGLVKTIFDAKTGELLGAHMVGAEVTELIQGYVIGRTLETTEEDLMNTVFPHPTMSEMMHEAVLDAYGRALHI